MAGDRCQIPLGLVVQTATVAMISRAIYAIWEQKLFQVKSRRPRGERDRRRKAKRSERKKKTKDVNNTDKGVGGGEEDLRMTPLELRNACNSSSLPLIPIFDPDDKRVVLFRGKKVRLHMHSEYNSQKVRLTTTLDKNFKQIIVGKRQGLERLARNSRHVPIKVLASPSIYMDKKIQAWISTYLSPKGDELKDRKRFPRLQLYMADDHTINSIRGFRRTAENRIYLYTLLQKTLIQDLVPPILILSDLANSCNVGAIARTALNLGIRSLLLTQTSWGTLNDTALRTSTYALLEMKLAVCEDLLKAIKSLQARGIETYCGENATAGAVKPISSTKSRDWALVVGSEMHGVPRRVMETVDHLVTIPQQGGDSFGVAHASVICLYELSREMPPEIT